MSDKAIFPLDPKEPSWQLHKQVSSFLMKTKKDIDSTTAPLIAIDLMWLFDTYLTENNFTIVKTKG